LIAGAAPCGIPIAPGVKRMPDPSWADGYVVDIDYTQGYYRELAPVALRFTALLGGVQATDADAAYTYYELGCGQGYSCALHAACNPRGRFYGVDFNPTHVHGARRLAQACGIGNVEFLEKSFAELLETDLPEADIVTLHGVHSWVSEENRRHIVEFLRRRLKPGGLVYVSYNCLPGLAQVEPLQRLLLEGANLTGSAPADRVRASLDFAGRLDKAGADYFQVNPLAKLRLAQLGRMDPSYIAHEYFNANWTPAYHADVAAEMAGAKLSYIGSATVVENFEQFSIRPEFAPLLAFARDRTGAETIKDFARNQVFRRDVFARGAPKAPPTELEAMLGRARFCLARPQSLCALTGKTPAGDISLQPETYGPVLDALARAPLTFDALARAPEAAALDRGRLRQAVFGHAALGNIWPALPAEGEAERRTATERFNAALLARGMAQAPSTFLASPVLGSGVPVSFIDQMLLAAPRNERDAVAQAFESLVASGQKLTKDAKPVDDPAVARTVIEEPAREFFRELLPYYRLVGVAA
jgi:SAM-dependent methyltransferase